MPDFPENATVNPVAPAPRPRQPGKRKPPIDRRPPDARDRRRPRPDANHTLDEYA